MRAAAPFIHVCLSRGPVDCDEKMEGRESEGGKEKGWGWGVRLQMGRGRMERGGEELVEGGRQQRIDFSLFPIKMTRVTSSMLVTGYSLMPCTRTLF